MNGEISAARNGLTFREKALKVWSIGGNNSAVECNLAKVEVAGSNPVSRSRFQDRAIDQDAAALYGRAWSIALFLKFEV